MTDINVQEIKEKLYEKVRAAGWGRLFLQLLMGPEFDTIIYELIRKKENNQRFTPPMKFLLRAFEECPYDTTKVVIVGMDPYPKVNVADGIAFSCSNLGKIEKSLETIYKSIYDTTQIQCTNPDLTHWANQGMLMLNSAFTVEINKPGTHCDLWRPFMLYLLEFLDNNKQDLIYVFMGKKAMDYWDCVSDKNVKIQLHHPASAAYNGSVWDCKDVWNVINNKLIEYGKEPIDYKGRL